MTPQKLLVLTYEDGLENGGYVGVTGSEAYPDRRQVTTEFARLGLRCIRHETRYDDPLVYGNRRCETRAMNVMTARITPGSSFFYGFAIYLPTDWIFDEAQDDILVQWKGFAGPPMAFLTEKRGVFKLRINYNTTPDPVDNYMVTKLEYRIAAASRGEWHDFMVQVDWDYRANGAGYFQVYYKRAVLPSYAPVLDYHGPNMYDGTGYLTWGIYKPGWVAGLVSARTVYHDNVAIGTSWMAVDPAMQTGA